MLRLDAVNAFYGKAHILHDVSFHIAPGEAVFLCGRNGAGKSTTLKTIVGLVRAAHGRIVFEDRNITHLPTHRIVRAGISYVPEERRIFTDLTVLENLDTARLPARAGQEGWTVERVFTLFPRLADMRTRKGGAMSGGEQQMLAIARALMGNPRLLLLDEPSEGLAPIIVEHLATAIRQLNADGIAVLLAEQNNIFATSIAHRMLEIETGSIKAPRA